MNVDVEMRRFLAKCKQTEADGVVGVHTSTSISNDAALGNAMTVIIQGTTIKLKNKKGVN